jgi:hypothetical protein
MASPDVRTHGDILKRLSSVAAALELWTQAYIWLGQQPITIENVGRIDEARARSCRSVAVLLDIYGRLGRAIYEKATKLVSNYPNLSTNQRGSLVGDLTAGVDNPREKISYQMEWEYASEPVHGITVDYEGNGAIYRSAPLELSKKKETTIPKTNPVREGHNDGSPFVDEIGLSYRVASLLKREAGIYTVGEWLNRDKSRRISRLGKKSFAEVEEAIRNLNIINNNVSE